MTSPPNMAGLNQRGVALITALLIAGMVSLVAVSLMNRQQVDIRKTANILDHDQTLQLALGVEAVAIGSLAVDGGADRKSGYVDYLLEDWALDLTLPEESDTASGRGAVIDLQGRFNLNNLVANDSSRREFSIRQLQYLLSVCELEPELWQPIVDWLDQDSEPKAPNGAEDEIYSSEDVPYLAANRFMVSPTELRLISLAALYLDNDQDRISIEGYDCLADLVTVLPGTTAINVNTAPAAVIASLDPAVDLAGAKLFVEERPELGYRTVEEFVIDPAMAGTEVKKNSAFLSVNSSNFLIVSEAQAGRGKIRLYSRLVREIDPGKVNIHVVARSIGVY